jgi:YidC/Oxa1 family membrane protein insertase
MDRNTIIRWIVIAGAILIFWKWGLPLITGKSGDAVQALPAETYKNAPDFAPDAIDPGAAEQKANPAAPPSPEELCTIKSRRFEATLSTRGAGITHYKLLDKQYATSDAADLSTTPDLERWRNLRTLFRAGPNDDSDQVPFDRFTWKLEPLGEAGNGCKFTYADDTVRIVKSVTLGARDFELDVVTQLTNLADGAKKHRYSIEAFAYRQNKEMKGSLGRQSPFMTELSCARQKDVQRKSPNDFKEGWFSEPLTDRYVAVSNIYFAQAIVPVAEGADKPECDIVAEQWYGAGQKPDDDQAGHVFHAKLLYPSKTLQKGQTAEYKDIAFFGPKEREVLALAAGGRGLGDLINLGFFTPVAKVLVMILVWIHSHITFGNWGLAIIVMTIGVRTILFPLTWKSIKTTVNMRKLKPEVDALNAKFKDDAQAKNLAMMELWRKHKVNPFGGCLPQLVQMPVWFAMYTTLQTAVEMYHTKFLWFTDLSAPDKFYILPIVLGGFMILQQRIVPQQGMDPMQQKMMTWMLPLVFTVMMLFLPAALGVYMLTNSILGIVQQLAVEKLAPRSGSSSASGQKKSDIVVKEVRDDSGPSAKSAPGSFGKGKARV